VVVTGAKDPRIAEGEVPYRHPGDQVAFLYHRGHCCGGLPCDQGTDREFAVVCRALWETRALALDRPGEWTGPEGLTEWVRRHSLWFRAVYRVALDQGYDPDTVVWGTPRSEDVDDPPEAFDLLSRSKARTDFATVGAADGFDDPAPAGMFLVVATRKDGRLKGTSIVYLPVPAPDEVLPDVRALGGAGRN
jgi:hypothetical protein